jgi:hypothetical protein
MSRPIEVGRRLRGAGKVVETLGGCWLARGGSGRTVRWVMGEMIMQSDSLRDILWEGRVEASDTAYVLGVFRRKAAEINARREAEHDPDMVVKDWTLPRRLR